MAFIGGVDVNNTYYNTYVKFTPCVSGGVTFSAWFLNITRR
jgi:hypothetical protein